MTSPRPMLVLRPPGLIQSPHESDIKVPFRSDTQINICGVFHAYDSHERLPPLHYWLQDVRLWSQVSQKFREQHYDTFQFTEYSSPDNWYTNHRSMPVTGTISTADFNASEISQGSDETKQDDPSTSDAEEHIRRLQEEIERLQRENTARQSQQPPQDPAAGEGNTGTPANEGVAFLQFLTQQQRIMQEQSQAFIATLNHMQAPATAAAPAPAAAPLTRPITEFPTWDGTPSTKPDFIFRLESMKKDRFFA
eukprot:scaffold142973_cov49-Cyclotella_meneghiniana.AAC.1